MHLFGGTSCVFVGCTIQFWVHCAHVHCRVHAKRIAHAHRALQMRIVHAQSRNFCSILDSIIEGHFGQILLNRRFYASTIQAKSSILVPRFDSLDES